MHTLDVKAFALFRAWADKLPAEEEARQHWDNELSMADKAEWRRRVLAYDELTAPFWCGIEVAPIDGRWILGLGNDGSVYRISWGRNHNNTMAWCTSFSSFVPGYITHWMPLAALPAKT